MTRTNGTSKDDSQTTREYQVAGRRKRANRVEKLHKEPKESQETSHGAKQVAQAARKVLKYEVKFLPDKPLAAEDEQADRFGHLGIAENLRDIIKVCPLPFTVGLFGKWGTGKTTILNLLRSRLVREKVPVVNFDVWKHEGDALRRTFLRDIVAQLKDPKYLPDDYKLSTRLDKVLETTRRFEKIDRITFAVTAAILLVLVVVGYAWYRINLEGFRIYLSVVLGGSLVSGLLLWLFHRMIVTEVVTESAERFQDPHEFESEFSKIIKKVGKSSGRLVVVIDNIDRCVHGKAVELLSTVKTFLAKDSDTEASNKCVFLIACDDEAIKKHLQYVYTKRPGETSDEQSSTLASHETSFSPDEFLRKFFNASLVLPDFIDTELQSYTRELLRETNIPQFDSANLAFVINAAFRDNPRQIKQFINILISHFLMAQNREAGANALICPAGTITENVPFLAKFLVVRQKFPDIYRTISQRHLVPEEWGQYGNTDFKDFHNATKMFTVGDVRPFMYLKQSPEERKIPGLRQIERGLVENNQDGVLKELQGLEKESEKVTHFNRFLLDLIERYRHVKSSLINILGCSLAVSKNLGLELDEQFYRRFEHLLNDPDGLKDSLCVFESSLIFGDLLPRAKKRYSNGIIAEYVGYVCLPTDQKARVRINREAKTAKASIGRDYAYDVLKEFAKDPSQLNDHQKSRVRRAIEESYSNDIEILSLFGQDTEMQNDFVSEKTISGFVISFSDDDVQDVESIRKKVQILLKFKLLIKSKAAEAIINKLAELLDAENKRPFEEPKKDQIAPKQNLLNLIEDILYSLVDEIKASKLTNELHLLAVKLNEGFNALPGWNERRIFVFPCLLLVDFLAASHRSNTEELVKSFFTNGDLESMQFVFENEKLSEKDQAKLIDAYPDIFKQRAIANQSVFSYLYPLASKETRPAWLVELINTDAKRALKLLANENYKTDDDKKVVEACLQKAPNVAVQDKSSIYGAINEMKCANDAGLKATLAGQIKSLLQTPDQQTQEVGYNALDGACAYLSNANRREIATEVIDWLRSPEISEPYQPHTIKSVILSWEILLDPAKKDYIYFIFHNLIMPRSNLDAIRLGFEVLSTLKILYEQNKTHFDDAFSVIESETREDIKAELLNGVISLRPQRSNKESAHFWSSVDKLRPDASKKDTSA